jgi:hypothetical protein
LSTIVWEVFFLLFFYLFFFFIWSLFCLFFPRCSVSDYPFGILKYVLHFSCKTNRLAYKIDIITYIKRGKQKENKRNRFIFPKLFFTYFTYFTYFTILINLCQFCPNHFNWVNYIRTILTQGYRTWISTDTSMSLWYIPV